MAQSIRDTLFRPPRCEPPPDCGMPEARRGHVGQSLGMSRWRIFTRICIPYALPTLFTGVRLSLSTAWAALVAAEMMASVQGLGYMIQMGRLLIKPDIIITGMLTIGCSGALMSLLLTLLENRLTKWGR